MEELPYTLSNAIPPSLVVFSQSGYGDPIRMQRPFNQVSDASGVGGGKDSSAAAAAAAALNSLPALSPSSSFGLRPMDSFPSLSAAAAAAQLVHLQNPFLHPALESHRIQFGSSSGAFRPISTATSLASVNQSIMSAPSSVSSAISTASSSNNNISSTLNNNNNNNNEMNNGPQHVKGIPSAFSAPALSISSRRKLDSIVESVMESRNREAAASSSVTAGALNLMNGSHHHHHHHIHQHHHQQHHQIHQQSQSHRHKSNSPLNHNSLSLSATSNNAHRDGDQRRSEDRDENLSPNSELTDRSTPEDLTPPPQQHHHSSKRRRKGSTAGSSSSSSSCDGLACPVCKMSLRPHELEAHLLGEVEQLMCMSRLRRTSQLTSQQRDEPTTSSSLDSPNGSTKKDSLMGPDLSQDSRWETYHRIRANRHSRLRIKTRRRREESGGNSHVTCPVCQIPLQGTNEQFSAHVESCLRKNGDMLDEDEPVDIEGDGDTNEMDEYNWIHNRRFAHSRNNPSSYSATALNMTTNSRRRDEDNDMELVVDGDETVPYGQPQYTEADVKAAAMAGANQPSSSHTNSSQGDSNKSKWSGDKDGESNNGEDLSTSAGNPINNHESVAGNNGTSNGNLVQTLKSKVHDLEKKLESGGESSGHCLVCKDKYKKPVVSVSCWHVHCEHCWLKTLYSQKLCPHCNAITSPSDLRRIFL